MERDQSKKGAAQDADPFINSCINGEINTPLIYEKYVPLDGFRCQLLDFELESLLRNDKLSFERKINEDTGEMSLNVGEQREGQYYNRSCEYWGLTITLKFDSHNRPIYGNMKGSFHKSYNLWNHGEKQNHDDFSVDKLMSFLALIESDLKIRPCNIHLTRLECGVNLGIPYDVDKIVNGFVFHHGKEFVSMPYYSAYGLHCPHGKYSIKVYNKGKQFSRSGHIIRIEIDHEKYSSFCNRWGIDQTLNALIESHFNGLYEHLRGALRNCIIYDPFILTEDLKIKQYRDSKFWKEINGNKRSRNRIKLERASKEKGEDIKPYLIERLDSKIEELNFEIGTNELLVYRGNSYHIDRSYSYTVDELEGITEEAWEKSQTISNEMELSSSNNQIISILGDHRIIREHWGI